MPSNNPIPSKLRLSSAELADSLSLSSDAVSVKFVDSSQDTQKSGASLRKYRPITALPENLSIKDTRNVSSTKAYITEVPSAPEASAKIERTVFPRFTIVPGAYTNQFADDTAPKRQQTHNAKQHTKLPKLKQPVANGAESSIPAKFVNKAAQPTTISDIHELEKQTMHSLVKKHISAPARNLKPLLPIIIQHQNRPEGIKSAEQHIKTGYECIKSFQYTEAIFEFDEAIKKCPSKADAYYGKALSFQSTHNFRLAEFYCHEALAREPKNVECLITLGTICSHSGNHSSAIDAFTRAVKINPSNPDAYFFRGCEYMKIYDFKHASADFRSAYSNGYNPVNVFKVEATMFRMQKNYRSAIDKCNIALEICPFDAPLHILRAECQELSGNFRAALGDYKVAMDCRPCIFDMEKCRSKIDNLSAYCLKGTENNTKSTRGCPKSARPH